MTAAHNYTCALPLPSTACTPINDSSHNGVSISPSHVATDRNVVLTADQGPTESQCNTTTHDSQPLKDAKISRTRFNPLPVEISHYSTSSKIVQKPAPSPASKIAVRSIGRVRKTSPSVPALTTIDSSDSASGSENEQQKRSRTKNGDDRNLKQYLHSVAARRMRQRLEDQALAAFPNSDYHETVDHYVNLDNGSDESFDDRPTTWDGHEDELLPMQSLNRDDTLGESLELLELREYHEMQDQERNVMKITAKQPTPRISFIAFGKGKPSSARLWSRPELSQTRESARPPMLGNDIVIPRSLSPEPSRLDLPVGTTSMQNSMCYLTAQMRTSARALISPLGMWGGLSRTVSTDSDRSGLWGGTAADVGRPCKKISHSRPGSVNMHGLRSVGHDDSSSGIRGSLVPSQFQKASYSTNSSRPSSRRHMSAPDAVRRLPSSSSPSMLSLTNELSSDGVADAGMSIENEYPDTFVTQVFNYLSLGYPSLARDFDDELSRVSQIPVSELRSDDALARAATRGYVRLGPDFETEGGVSSGIAFVRWRALKLYIHDWGRAELQRSDSARKHEDDDIYAGTGKYVGTAPRRGSWAW